MSATTYGDSVGGWRRCETCRKVKSVDEYAGDGAVCQACLAPPTPRRRTAAATVTRRAAPPAAAPALPRRPAAGAVGSGDLEARERRAKRTAWEQLAELHQEEYEQLLQVARRAEGLRT